MAMTEDALRLASGNLPDVFSPRELARFAGVPLGLVRQLIASADIATVDGEFIDQREAVQAARSLRAGRWSDDPGSTPPRFVLGETLFAHHTRGATEGLSLIGSTIVHAAILFLGIALTTVRISSVTDAPRPVEPSKLVHLVFVAEPGPGGGGGGGGLKRPDRPPQARKAGTGRISSPIPKRPPPRPIELPKEPEIPQEPPALENTPLPPLLGPIVSVAANTEDRMGTLEVDAPDSGESQGPGTGGGTGSGAGSGIGEGTGAGIGAGSGGGAGGGPYRPGSGIEPPRLLREVKPNYTEAARRASLEGDVVLEIVVRHDGTVSDVRVVHRLGSGLDEEAVRAVRQWRFAPARRLGQAVDVLVEIAVEFRLR